MLPESTSAPQRRSTQMPVNQQPSPPEGDWWNGSPDQQLAYVFGLAIAGLIVVAFIANGAGAGSQHHHVVQYILAGLFITGAGVLGLLGMNAACGCCGIDTDANADESAAEELISTRSEQWSEPLPIGPSQTDTIPLPTQSTPVPPAPAVASRPAPNSPLATEREPDTDFDDDIDQEQDGFPHSSDFRARRRRRARRA
ncbi:MAG: hypothetical protein KDA88_00170 [Planctomycetaceae bacterium]|nr:hypothetical protein [Planctomycetaceae bacterium]MCB9950269.1 hypothetical protein [Planctomycetaceae bacterium]